MSLLAGAPALAQAPEATQAAPGPQHDCLVGHVNDARALNGKRRSIYATWAGQLGLSRVDSWTVSTVLIGSEIFSLRDSKKIDQDAREFQVAGIPIVCDDLRPISDAGPDPECPKDKPCFVLDRATGEPMTLPPMEMPDYVKAKPHKEWAAKIDVAYKADVKAGGTTFPETLKIARGIFVELEKYPRFLCMGRHLVESTIRIAALAPGYEATRIEKRLPNSTLPLSRRLLESHITLLGTVGEALGLDGLDTRAAKLQAMGLPIICNDVPPIPDPGGP